MNNKNMKKRLELIKSTIEYHCIEENTDRLYQLELTGFLEAIYNMACFDFSDESLDTQLKAIKQTIDYNNKQIIKK